MSGTAKLADYVIAPKLHYETHGNTALNELIGNFGGGWGYENTYGQVCDPIMTPPAGAEVAEEYEFFHELTRCMRLPLNVTPMSLLDPKEAAENQSIVDQNHCPSPLEAWSMVLKGAPLAHDEARRDKDAYGGKVFDPDPVLVAGKPDDWAPRLELADIDMLRELADVFAKTNAPTATDEFPLRVISRRLHAAHNSNWRDVPALKSKHAYNPAYMNPEDMAAYSVHDGDIINISSLRATIACIVKSAPDVRQGCISISHAWGANPDEHSDPASCGSNTGKLCETDRVFDLRTGIPLMSAVPVRIESAN